jgi:hypothetical protein
MGKTDEKQKPLSPPSQGPKWYNVLLLVLFFVVIFIVGMFCIGPW